MADFQFLVFSIACKATLLLAIVSLVMFVGARRWPAACMIWQRVGIFGLLILPFAVCVVPTIGIPILSSESHGDMADAAVVLPRTVCRRSSNDSPVVEFAGESSGNEREMTDAASAIHFTSIPIQSAIIDAVSVEPVRRTISQRPNLLFGIIFTYGLVLSGLLVRFFGAWRGLERMKQASSPVSDAQWLNAMSNWIGVLRVNVPVELRVSDDVSIPMTFGGHCPVLLIPRHCLSTCDPTQRAAILIHELTHISRRDFQWQILTKMAASLYWFHPLAWFVRREAAALQERLCDSICSQYLGSATYGKTLVEIAFRSLRTRITELGIAMAHPSSLRRRLNDLNSCPKANAGRGGRGDQGLVVGVAAVVLGVVIFGMLTARIPGKPPAQATTAGSPAAAASTAVENADTGIVISDGPNGFPTFLTHDLAFNRDQNLSRNNPEFQLRQIGLVTYSTLNNDPENQEQEVEPGWEDDKSVFNAQVAATVNGEPILNGDILDRFSLYLIRVREEMIDTSNTSNLRYWRQAKPSVEEFKKLREAIIQREIAVYIQGALLVQHLKANVTPEEFIQLNKGIDEQFEKAIESLKRELNVSDNADLDLELHKKKTSLQAVKSNFVRERLSSACFSLKARSIAPVEDSEIQEYYQQDDDQFEVPRSIDWQQICLNKVVESTDDEVRKGLDDVLDELKRGESLEKVVAAHSRLKADTSRWENTKLGSLNDRELETQLFSMPLNEWRLVDDRKSSPSVVRVTDRRDARRKSIDEVREEIRERLEGERRNNCYRELMRTVYSSAVIETRYSLPQKLADQ